jgi:hypothetical protein
VTRHLAVLALLIGPAVAAGAATRPAPVGAPGKHAVDTCTACHAELDEERLRGPAASARIDADVHHLQGIGCAGCHGGDPSSDDPDTAMNPAAGFVGRFAARAIPELCASCHADAAFMLRYGPNIPTDQLDQYRTSRHGQALAKGDSNVATCVSCHGAHGVLPAGDARSPVYPSRIVETCGHCHGDAALMQRYGVSGREPADYKRSVHYAALTQKNDLSAPTCNDCHGSHGATPPGVSSVSNVCGSCHLSQRERFDLSPHKEAFAALEHPACETCHSNHAVVHPGDQWVGVGPDQVCGECHGGDDAGGRAATAIAATLAESRTGLEQASRRVERVERAGMLMDAAQVRLEEAHQAYVLAQLELHTADPAAVAAQTAQVRAGFDAAGKFAADAEAEIRFRRTGLFVSLGVIALAMVALFLKVRQLER